MGAVHGVEPARETVVFGLRCFLKKSAFVASIENQKLLHKELNVKLLFKKKIRQPGHAPSWLQTRN